jgi:aspartyl protease family protein
MRSMALFMLLISQTALCQQQEIEVLGLFAEAAMLRINGTELLLKAGAKSPDGVLLVSADSQQAVIEVGGKRVTLHLSERINSAYEAPTIRNVAVQINEQGQYITTGSINGRPVSFLIDTGANVIAINSKMAASLGIDFESGKSMETTTASGSVRSRAVMLDTVHVGEISVSNVQAVVLEGDFPVDILLGMSFLKNVKIEENAGLMLLQAVF